jgi:hypothetical protein
MLSVKFILFLSFLCHRRSVDMTRNKQVRVIFALIMIVLMMLPSVALADDRKPGPDGYGPGKPPVHIDGPGPKPGATGPSVPPPIAITGPRVNPRAIPHSGVINPAVTYNWVVAGNVPQALEANAADGGKTQEAVGRGVKQTITGLGQGISLYATPNVCNNFNMHGSYAAVNVKSDVWTDWYAGWGPFAIDNGYYQAKNVVFTMERVVGPGSKYNDTLSKGDGEQASVKIGSHEPYAAGFGSPIIPVPEEYRWGTVTVSVKYLIWDHDQGGKQGGPDGNDWDWASMGVKPGAAGENAYYVNGYVRGEWSELVQTVELGGAPDTMVLIQGQSPSVLNSNIYFDDVKIAFSNRDGSKSVYLTDCTLAGSIK